jgi:hypothetical protein
MPVRHREVNRRHASTLRFACQNTGSRARKQQRREGRESNGHKEEEGSEAEAKGESLRTTALSLAGKHA